MEMAPHASAVAPAGDIGWFTAALARAGTAAEGLAPVVRTLVGGAPTDLHSDDVIAHTRGMIADVAGQLATALTEGAGAGKEAARHDATVRERDGAAIAALLTASAPFLMAVHALALEWHVTDRLDRTHGIDPVLPPLMAEGIAAADPDLVGAAKAVLAAQARFCSAQRRMQLPLSELPADLFRIAVQTLHACALAAPAADAQSRAIIAERSLRLRFDAERGRLALLRRLFERAPEPALWLEPAHAGAALFLTALARIMGAPREEAVLLTSATQAGRLALVLRAAGMDGAIVRRTLLCLHPDVAVPPALDDLDPAAAAALVQWTPDQ
jgi:hypothetical protein